MSQYIVVLPGCTEYGVRWASSIISFFSAKSFGIQSLFPNLKTPLLGTLNSGLFPSCTSPMIFTICTSSTYELLIFSIKVGCIVKLAIKIWESPMKISIPILSKSLIISFWVVNKAAEKPEDFRLSASTTTLALPGW